MALGCSWRNRMIHIKINRYVIKQLEKAIDKYNDEKPKHFPRITDYSDMIDKALQLYLGV